MSVAQDSFERLAAKGARAKGQRSAWLIYGTLALLVILALLGLAGYVIVHRDAPVTAVAAPGLTVTTALPVKALWTDTVDTSGAVAPWQEASIGSQIGGYQLTDVLVNVGDEVKKGQVLARFDSDLLRAAEAQLQANYDQAAANEKRSLALEKVNAIAAQDVLLATTNAKVAQALLAANQLQIRYADVVAPDFGVISARSATLGAVVPVGQELFRLIRQNRLEWRGELTASQIVKIAVGQTITLTLPDGSNATAKVRQLAPSLDSQSRLGTVYADIAPGSHALAGMYANGEVALDQRQALSVPAEAVVIRDGRNYVLVPTDAGATPRVHQREVVTGRRHGENIEIVEGLDVNTPVVVKGAGFLNDNDLVRVVGRASSR
jgi:RND family efflux transporter MFP subunit